MAAQGNDVHDAAAARAVADAVAVATLWLDEQTTLASPAWRATGLSRAEWVEATMPRWFELIEPVSDGVTAATSDAMRKQVGELGPEAFGEALPEGLPEGFDPRQMVEQWAPMLGNLSRQMFSAQLGQAVGTLATEVVTGTEVGLPLTEPGVVALLPGNVAELAESLEIDIAQVRLYLAVREAARVRLFSEVPWLGPQLLSAVSDYARNITIDTDAIESALSTIDPSDPEALRTALQGNLFRPQPTPAQRAALDRLETLLALAEGWVDHVTDRTTARHLPLSAALAETIRRRRVGGAAQKTFAGLVGLELRPRRLRDAANLWAALESAGGATLRDGRWAHPDLAPTSADLDDPIGYVERATGTSAAGALPEGGDNLGVGPRLRAPGHPRGGRPRARHRQRHRHGTGTARARRGRRRRPAVTATATRRHQRRPAAVTGARRPPEQPDPRGSGEPLDGPDGTAWRRLHDDAVARLESWAAPDERAGAPAHGVPRPPPRPPGRDEQGRTAGTPHGQRHRARRRRRRRAADPAPPGPGVVPVRRTLRAGRRDGVARGHS